MNQCQAPVRTPSPIQEAQRWSIIPPICLRAADFSQGCVPVSENFCLRDNVKEILKVHGVPGGYDILVLGSPKKTAISRKQVSRIQGCSSRPDNLRAIMGRHSEDRSRGSGQGSLSPKGKIERNHAPHYHLGCSAWHRSSQGYFNSDAHI